MAKKLEMIKLVAGLEKLYRTTEAPIWDDLAYRLSRPSRQSPSINLERLDRLAKKFKGKTLIVPGKVLGEGELSVNAKIVAVSASEKAMKIAAKKGEIVLMKDFIKTADKAKTSDLVIAK
jgi:large subunit ribosomal protein L18e